MRLTKSQRLFKECKARRGFFKWQGSSLYPDDRHLGKVLDGSCSRLQLKKNYTFNCWEACLALSVAAKNITLDDLVELYENARSNEDEDSWGSQTLMEEIGFYDDELSRDKDDFKFNPGDFVFFGDTGSYHVCIVDANPALVWSHWLYPIEGICRTTFAKMVQYTRNQPFMVATPPWM